MRAAALSLSFVFSQALWYGARGPINEQNLSNWVEPANRLATLLYLMGRLKESLAWCEMIIDAKPWHIGALSGVVMVCLKMNDEENAKKFISMGLPNLSTEMRDARKKWVEKNVDSAKQSLLQLKSSNAVYKELAKSLEMSSREIAPTMTKITAYPRGSDRLLHLAAFF